MSNVAQETVEVSVSVYGISYNGNNLYRLLAAQSRIVNNRRQEEFLALEEFLQRRFLLSENAQVGAAFVCVHL